MGRKSFVLIISILLTNVAFAEASPSGNDKTPPVSAEKPNTNPENKPAPPPTPEPEEPVGPVIPSTDETPGKADLVGTEPEPEIPEAPVAIPEVVELGYPRIKIDRPLTLLRNMPRLILETPVHVNPFAAAFGLYASFGVTERVQIGAGYFVGTVDKNGFSVGKVVSPTARVLILDWLSVEAAIPVHMDPTAVGLTLGAPMYRKVSDRLAVFGGHNAVNIKINKFFPSLENAAVNAANVFAHQTNTTLPNGDYRLLGGIDYMLQKYTSLTVESGIIAPDFGLSNGIIPVRASIRKSFHQNFDAGARIGTDSLEDIDTTFFVSLFAEGRLE